MLHALTVWGSFLLAVLSQFVSSLFWAPASRAFYASLGTSFLLAAAFLAWRRRGHRPHGWRVWHRALFPRRWLIGPSAKADIGIYLFNTATYTILFGWLVLSGEAIASLIHTSLAHTLGTPAPTALPAAAILAIVTTVLFLAYEFGYWLDHYLMHRFDFLWPFHKVHHTAETLSPLTNFRMHPVDSILFGNTLALSMGAAYGAACFALGTEPNPAFFAKTTIFSAVFSLTTGPLQHSHIWMPFRGLLGRIVLSPAHHQLHHSNNPRDFNSNFGSALSLYDTLFGTLNVPTVARPHLTFGVTPPPPHPHALTGWLLVPFAESWSALRPRLRRASVAAREAA
jgi:sterol desaturase/sphingolipid hydroxylase (fatty acid hydroxylase superfamily)